MNHEFSKVEPRTRTTTWMRRCHFIQLIVGSMVALSKGQIGRSRNDSNRRFKPRTRKTTVVPLVVSCQHCVTRANLVSRTTTSLACQYLDQTLLFSSPWSICSRAEERFQNPWVFDAVLMVFWLPEAGLVLATFYARYFIFRRKGYKK